MKRWTVLLIGLVLTGCTTVAGATGGTTQNAAPEKVTVQIYVDNQEIPSVDGYRVAGKLYLPVEDVIEREVSTDADASRVRIYLRPPAPTPPHVDRVVPQYDQKIRDAVDLLAEKAPEHYQKLAANAEMIIPGFDNATLPEANVITISQVDLDKGTVTWIAGTLAHEAEHLRIYHTDRALYADAKENERLAYEANLDALKLVGADQREIDWTLKALKDPPTWEDVAK